MSKSSSYDQLTDEWTPCDDPIVSDVIRWTEPIWSPQKRQRGKLEKIGDQRITGEVLSLSGDAPLIYVMDVEQVGSGPRFKKLSVEPGAKIKRRTESVVQQGQCERLLWIDEGVRDFTIETGKKGRK